ncbi:MAG: lipoyl(octanoyl) transferase LipB [Bacteroidia bacterium]|nr:lipoyl(octanoyl) transferase LipB [Bacteroidia bacterium]
MKPAVQYRDLGLIDYAGAWKYQEELFASITGTKVSNRDREADLITLPENYLLLCEHPHVFTLGKSGDISHLKTDEEELKRLNATFFRTNRGGDITYHGPGQIVGYPLLDLDQFFTDIHRYLRGIEEVIIRALADHGINAARFPGYTGVWIEPESPVRARKICAIGVRTSRWVTMHGWALNVNTDLSWFNRIIPCGISDKAVTSMNRELGMHVEQEEVKQSILRHFGDVFSCEINRLHQ